jgi:hypothetical protein
MVIILKERCGTTKSPSIDCDRTFPRKAFIEIDFPLSSLCFVAAIDSLILFFIDLVSIKENCLGRIFDRRVCLHALQNVAIGQLLYSSKIQIRSVTTRIFHRERRLLLPVLLNGHADLNAIQGLIPPSGPNNAKDGECQKRREVGASRRKCSTKQRWLAFHGRALATG